MTNSRRRFFRDATVVGAGLVSGAITSKASIAVPSNHWDHEADVVVIGAGATGLPAAIEARERGASVLLVEANHDVGGHAILNMGNLSLGGGTSLQKKHNIADSPDLLFSDLTDWSVVESNGFPDYRYNDKEVIRAFADNAADTFEWLNAHGVVVVDLPPDGAGGLSVGNSVPRQTHVSTGSWSLVQTGLPVNPEQQGHASSGVGLIRPLEAAARKLGIPILLEHKMTDLIREEPHSGRVIGVVVESKGTIRRFRARKAVILGTGGSTGNVNFRRIFDPRLTEEYNGSAGEPWSFQDASGELAAMAVGASLWGAYNQVGEFGNNITKPGLIGTQYGYGNLQWKPTSSVFSRARATGLHVRDWQDAILVNLAGKRFYDETAGSHFGNDYNSVRPYVPGSHSNLDKLKYDAHLNFLNAALSGIGSSSNGGGPIWAIFDAGALKREGWIPEHPYVDRESKYFFSANTVAELATSMVMKHQPKGLPASALEETVARYNSFVDAGSDSDFGKPQPLYKIQSPPFYAAWATPVIHDTRAGLRINAHSQVVDVKGEVIPGLYCGGESAGGFSMHGMARGIVQGRIAAQHVLSS